MNLPTSFELEFAHNIIFVNFLELDDDDDNDDEGGGWW